MATICSARCSKTRVLEGSVTLENVRLQRASSAQAPWNLRDGDNRGERGEDGKDDVQGVLQFASLAGTHALGPRRC